MLSAVKHLVFNASTCTQYDNYTLSGKVAFQNLSNLTT